MSKHDLKRARSYFNLEAGITYLNHASHAPLALPVRIAYEKFFDSWQRTAHDHDTESFRLFEELRGKLGRFINASSQRVGFSPHTTFGMNIIASGLCWQNGDNIVISQREFPASVYPWLRLRSKGVAIRMAETRDGFIDEDALIGLADRRTRLIHTSWVQFNNGNRVDLHKLGQFCADNDVLLSIDGIQGTGVVPIDVPSLKIDLFTCGCQKWMLGPCGSGFYYLSERAESLIDPPYSGWMSVDWKSEFSDLLRYDLEPRIGSAKFEIGTYPFQDLRALNAAVDILQSFDRQVAWDHISSMVGTIISYINDNSSLQLVSPPEPSRRSGIVSFRSQNSRRLFEKLTHNGFVISFRENGIRISPHFYNGQDEIDKLLAAISDFSV